MPMLSAGELLQAFIDSCRRTTDAVLCVEGRNPYRLSLNGDTCTVFIANVSHASRSDADEYRIQCPGELPSRLSRRSTQGEAICILGYHAESGAFSAWDPALFLQRSRTTRRFSLYTRLSSLHRASANGFDRHVDAGGQTVLLFRQDYLALYIENVGFIHRATDRALKSIVDLYGSTPVGTVPRRQVTVARRKVRLTHTQYARSPHFRQEVLSAYGNRCAMCRLQLELVEAAHLVPHAHPEGLDVVENGIALCALHHRSLDTALLYIDGDYQIRLNHTRYRYLRKVCIANGIKLLKRNVRKMLDLPRLVSQHPRRENILLGNRLRGIGID